MERKELPEDRWTSTTGRGCGCLSPMGSTHGLVEVPAVAEETGCVQVTREVPAGVRGGPHVATSGRTPPSAAAPQLWAVVALDHVLPGWWAV